MGLRYSYSPSDIAIVGSDGEMLYTSIASPPDTPTNVLARNVGNGCLEVQWDLSGGVIGLDIDHCDVYLSTTLGGTYTKANKRPVKYNKAILSNLPFNSVVYVKVTSTDMSGEESAMSAAADDGYAIRSNIELTLTGPSGDVVPEGTMFAGVVGDGNLVAFRTLEDGTLS